MTAKRQRINLVPWLIGLMIVMFPLWMLAQFLNAQVFSSLGAPHEYGSIQVPGSKTLSLPAGTAKIFVEGINAIHNPTSVTVTVTGTAPLPVTPDIGGEFCQGGGGSAGAQNCTHYRRLAHLTIPSAGRYTVTASGGASGDQVDLGQERPLSGNRITVIALGVEAVLLLVTITLAYRNRRRS